MKIGIIGTGNMGRALGTGWARAGHDVLFGSRNPAKAKDAGLRLNAVPVFLCADDERMLDAGLAKALGLTKP
jgi:3-hydroxyisobutyrate dehydrogenase-like beta-hydroxyacid dehydrogenase